MRTIAIALALVLITITTPALSQKETERNLFTTAKSNKDIKSLLIDANRIKTILYNTGSLSGPGVTGNVYDFTWNGLGYAYEIGFLAGAKVPSALNVSDSIKFIVDGFGAANKYTADGDFAPDGVTKWGWLPTANSSNPNSNNIANNQDPTTWPATWPTWNGKFGNAIADLELLYEMNDSTDAEFPYYPFPMDSSRRGLGLKVEARYYQFAHPNLEDVLFTFFEIQNVSTKTLTQMVSGIIGDPHIGGSNNYADDTQDFDKQHGLMYSWDPDGKGDVPSIVPGYFGFSIISSPAQKGVTSYNALMYGGNNRPKNDTLIYDAFSEGSKKSSNFFSSDSNNFGDFILFMGSGFYSLAPNQKEELGVTYLFAQDLKGLIERTTIISQEYSIRFSKQGNAINLTSPVAGQKIQSNSIDVQWTTSPLDADTTIDLYYSNTPDEKWNPIAKSATNNGLYQWNIASLPDGIFYKLHILKKKDGFVSYDSTGGYFIIDKPGDAYPEIRLLSPKNIKTVKNTFPVQWIAGDADGDAVAIKIYYSDNDGYTYTLLEQVNNSGTYLFDTKKRANTPTAKIKLEAVANGKSVVVESKTFRVGNFFFALTDTSTLKHISGIATGDIMPGVADSASITGNTYQITFDSLNGSLRYHLKNLSTNQIKLANEPLTMITGSGTLVDGMRIWFDNHKASPDTAKCKFGAVPANISSTIGTTFSSLKSRFLPIDFAIIFSSLDTNAFGDYSAPADSFPPLSGTGFVKAPFKIKNLTDTSSILIRIREIVGPETKSKRWDFNEEILFIVPPLPINSSSLIHASVVFKKINVSQPHGINDGDTFYLIGKKSFTVNDVYQFTADVKYGKPTFIPKDASIPKEYSLGQNYPNPFNPETKIQFSIPHRGWSSLKIFDSIGREVKTLFNEELQEGTFTTVWDGKNMYNQISASGVYFYRLQSGNFTQTKKMVLMR